MANSILVTGAVGHTVTINAADRTELRWAMDWRFSSQSSSG